MKLKPTDTFDCVGRPKGPARSLKVAGGFDAMGSRPIFLYKPKGSGTWSATPTNDPNVAAGANPIINRRPGARYMAAANIKAIENGFRKRIFVENVMVDDYGRKANGGCSSLDDAGEATEKSDDDEDNSADVDEDTKIDDWDKLDSKKIGDKVQGRNDERKTSKESPKIQISAENRRLFYGGIKSAIRYLFFYVFLISVLCALIRIRRADHLGKKEQADSATKTGMDVLSATLKDTKTIIFGGLDEIIQEMDKSLLFDDDVYVVAEEAEAEGSVPEGKPAGSPIKNYRNEFELAAKGFVKLVNERVKGIQAVNNAMLDFIASHSRQGIRGEVDDHPEHFGKAKQAVEKLDDSADVKQEFKNDENKEKRAKVLDEMKERLYSFYGKEVGKSGSAAGKMGLKKRAKDVGDYNKFGEDSATIRKESKNVKTKQSYSKDVEENDFVLSRRSIAEKLRKLEEKLKKFETEFQE